MKRKSFAGPGPWWLPQGGAHPYLQTPDDDPAFLYQNLLLALEAFSKDWDKVRSLHLDGSPDETSWFAGDGWWLSTSEPPGRDAQAA